MTSNEENMYKKNIIWYGERDNKSGSVTESRDKLRTLLIWGFQRRRIKTVSTVGSFLYFKYTVQKEVIFYDSVPDSIRCLNCTCRVKQFNSVVVNQGLIILTTQTDSWISKTWRKHNKNELLEIFTIIISNRRGNYRCLNERRCIL